MVIQVANGFQRLNVYDHKRSFPVLFNVSNNKMIIQVAPGFQRLNRS